MTMSRKQKVDRILSVIPPYGQEIHSDRDAARFAQVTYWTHQGLLTQWADEQTSYDNALKKKKSDPKVIAIKATTTTCNAFTGWYGNQLGCSKAVGRFDIDKKLPEAWVPCSRTSGNRPGYGDICRFSRYHVGISLDFEDDVWNSVEGGQGGPKSGRDVVKRKKTPWSAGLLKGWIDISLLPGVDLAQPVTIAGTNWLVGWWKVMCEGTLFYYRFDDSGRVGYTRTPPLSPQQSLQRPIGTGRWTDGTSVRITWSTNGTTETLRKSLDDTQMRGVWNGRIPIVATRI